MSDRPKRAILSLKNPPPKPKPVERWKCKPCGETFEVAPELADEDAERCPACNARLGRARQFREETPEGGGMRARRVADAPVPPPPIPVIKQR